MARGGRAPLHKSLSDYLTDARSSGPHAVDVAAGHALLAAQLLSSVGGGGGGPPSTYTLKYLVRHLVAAHDMPALEELLSRNHEFLAAVFAHGHGHTLIRDALHAQQPSPLLRDCQRWLLAQQHELANATTVASVRASMLRCPIDTLIFQTTEQQRLVELTEAGKPAWRLSKAIGKSPTWPEVRLDAKGHKGTVRCVCWSQDGRTLASGCEAGEFRLWDAQSGECIAILQSKGEGINTVQWRPDGLKLATGGLDKQLRVWDTASGLCELVIEVGVNV
ncbi:Vegetative incompatibility protein HET-E-1 [Tetrabaena socialis]|uniref:Vegetative incompatibility protein HET-E-1 n=1 Tax=Tetrabaena socialis TaxID=47790 RepID=A0A2J8A3M3_9CHLO|nr:Vegetative incompatibility protein HET-E-1 [Tetrabaena socialis]|eukprot:PNH07129.1 Vegetative incompatibility protein HET-E-1 [Tetrabaena socialis]